MSKSQNDVAVKSMNVNEAALQELEALAAEWVERQRQRLKVTNH